MFSMISLFFHEIVLQGNKEIKMNSDKNPPVIIFRENNFVIAYCPTLELSGYGYSEKEARDSFDIVLSEFLKYSAANEAKASDVRKSGRAASEK